MILSFAQQTPTTLFLLIMITRKAEFRLFSLISLNSHLPLTSKYNV